MSSLVMGVPILIGGYILFSKVNNYKKLSIVTMIVTLVLTILINYYYYNTSINLLTLINNVNIGFKIDSIAILFSTLISFIFLAVGIYTLDYMEHYHDLRRYYSYYLMTLGLLLGVAYADNMVTLYMFFELMTLSATLLVIHERSKYAYNAARKFLYYSIFGAAMGLMGIILLYANYQDTNFVVGGFVTTIDNNVLLFTLLAIIGFACKAGLYPLHGWLTSAHPIAPAPASAVLSGIITKAGIIAIIRIVYYVIGIDNIVGTYIQEILIILSLVTIFLGSLLALRENLLKKRLAYSSISQLSYIILGLLVGTKVALLGALLQVVFHALAKTLLFLSAGSIIHSTALDKVRDLKGYGYAMNETFMMILIGGLSLVGIPLTGGFVAKWYLATGSLELGRLGLIGVSIIMISALLTAGYLLYLVNNAYVVEQKKIIKKKYKLEKNMKVGMIILAILIIVGGIFPTPIIEYLNGIIIPLYL